MGAKLSSELANALDHADADAYVDVILELETDSQTGTTGNTREEKIAALKDSFEESLTSVDKAVRDVGGEIIRGAWINRTARARVPANKVTELAKHEKIIAVDVPHPITPDFSKQL
jgi:hypothetical protein